jgi:hypothetical protein
MPVSAVGIFGNPGLSVVRHNVRAVNLQFGINQKAQMIYRTICTQLWTDKKIQRLTVQGKLLFVYLITNPHTHLSGIYYLPEELIAKETGLSLGPINTLFNTLSELERAYYDDETSTVFVVNMFGYQGQGEKNERSCANQLEGLHDSPLICRFLERYPKVKRFCTNTLLDTLSTLSKIFPSVPVPLSDPLPDLLTPPNLNLKSNGYAEEFEQFWLAYPKKVGKKDALQAWKRAKDKPPLVDMVQAIDKARQGEQWTKENGQFIPNPSTWLNQGRWADEPLAKRPSTMDAFLTRQPYRKEIPS